jgi:hypothetical protein
MLCRMSDADNPKPESDVTTEPEASETPSKPAEPSKTTELAETQELAPEDRPEAPTTPAERQVVYVHAPVPPKVIHNRLFGALLALLGTAVYGLLFFGAVAVLIALTPGAFFESTALGFVNSSAFWVPVLFFAFASIVLAIVLNRAPWSAHVVGSILVAIFVFWATAGVLALLTNIVTMTPDEASAVFWAIAGNPILFIAAILAREVPLWVGLAIATRGRKVRARNAEAKTAYDAEQAEKKAEYERAAATV